MSKEGKRCVIYSRVSTEMQVDGFSLAGQKTTLKRYVDKEEMILVKEYEDAGKSGKSITGRPAFKQMLEDIENGLNIDYIIVYKLSRFGRNAADVLTSLELIQSYDVNLICTEEGIDSSQTSGRLLISVLSAVAEIERENIIEQSMNGRLEKARQGGWNGGVPPYGYKLVNKEIVIDEPCVDSIVYIFNKFTTSNITPSGLANEMNMKRIIKVPTGICKVTTWYEKTIREIIKNPIYCGNLAYGRIKTEKVKGTRNEYKRLKTKDFLVVKGKHQAIISEEVFNKAQEKLKERSELFQHNEQKCYPLSGLLKCPGCNKILSVSHRSWSSIRGPNSHTHYYCSSNKRLKKDACKLHPIYDARVVELIIITIIKMIIRSKQIISKIQEELSKEVDTGELQKELKEFNAKLKSVNSNKEFLEREIDTLPLEIEFREEVLKDLNKRLYSLYGVINNIKSSINDVEVKIKAIEANNVSEANILKVFSYFDEIYFDLKDIQKKELIRSLIKEVQMNEPGSEFPIKSIEFNFPIAVENKSRNEYNNKKVKKINYVLSFNGDDVLLKPIDILKNTPNIEKMVTVKIVEIKDYIKEKYNVLVSREFIIKVRHQLGLIYKKDEYADSMQIKKYRDNDEKVKLVKEAYRHFGVIDENDKVIKKYIT